MDTANNLDFRYAQSRLLTKELAERKAEMGKEYWFNKWKESDIHFHLRDAHPVLIRYFSTLPQGTIFVPLCGKSVDMYWLLSKGHTVIGVELSSIACDAFFQENNLKVKIQNVDECIKYEGDGVTLWCGDFFTLPINIFENVTTIYDRAALFALAPAVRKKYVNKIKEIAAPLTKLDMLLITIEFDQSLKEGPPFSVTENEVREYYSSRFSIEKLKNGDASTFQHHPKFKNIPIKDEAYWLKKI